MTYIKINKPTAFKLWHEGKNIFLCPCNGNPAWCAVRLGTSGVQCDKNAFERRINNFMYYNCNAELGRRVAYYIEG